MTQPRTPLSGTYPGKAHWPGLGGGAATPPPPPGARQEGRTRAGRLSLVRGQVRFEGDAGTCALDLDRAILRLGGADDDLVFFGDPDDPRRTLFTDDRSILRDPELQRHPRLAKEARRIRRSRATSRGLLLGCPVLVVLVVVVLWMMRGVFVDWAVAGIPTEWERGVGRAMAEQIIEPRRIDEEALQAELERMVAPLVQAADAPFEVSMTLIDDDAVNAFAVPGGFVAVHSGLVLEAGSEPELLGVLAHELAHVELRHGLRNVVSSAGLFLVVQSLFGDLSGLAAVAVDGGRELVTLGFSRDAEREADERAVELLRAAGVDPGGLARFLRRLRVAEEEAGISAPAFLSTHPSSEERIERLESRGADRTGILRVSGGFAEFREGVSRAVGDRP